MTTEKKTWLITGAGRGMGVDIAKAALAAGHNVVATGRNPDSVAQAIGDSEHLLVAKLDVTSTQDAEAAVAAAVDRFGDIDVLVNNAGITRDTLIARMSDEDWEVVINTNLRGAFNTARAVSRKMLRRRSGAIVNLTSVVGLHGNPGQANYAASKAGIIGLTKALARELGSRGVRVNAVAPGYIDTALTQVLPEPARGAILANTPLSRLGEPEDVAAAVRFLCSDEASFVTGEVLLVDGGLGM
jgi:3-oxoacyl-[acyl-carrier protein] reductase